MNFVEEKTRAETIFQRELTDKEFAEVLMERIDHLQNEIEGRDTHIENLQKRLSEATETDEWDDLRNKVEEILSMPGDYHMVTLKFFGTGKITMSFNVDGMPIKSTAMDYEGDFDD